jgi:hypothetical protein
MEYSLAVTKEMVRIGADIIWLGDDVGAQEGMLISPVQWRKTLKERLRTIITELKREKPEIQIAYHCCGSYFPIMGELIEAGVDILNALQPIGKAHRTSIALNGDCQLAAGAFSSSTEKNLASGRDLGVDDDRIYASFAEMAQKEAAREDGIDFAVIVPPQPPALQRSQGLSGTGNPRCLRQAADDFQRGRNRAETPGQGLESVSFYYFECGRLHRR